MRTLTRTWGFEQLGGGRLRVWVEVPHGGAWRPSPARYDGGRDEPPAPSTGDAHPADR